MEACKDTKVVRRLLARIFALFREYRLQRRHSVHGDSTEEEEMRRQQRMKIMKNMTRKILSK